MGRAEGQRSRSREVVAAPQPPAAAGRAAGGGKDAAGRAADGGDATRRRRRAYRRGLWAETLAAAALSLEGWRVIGRRVPMRAMEIDLVVVRGDVVALVEVKARRSRAEALAAVTARDGRRMAAAARQWLALNPRHAGRTLRLDIVAVVPWRWPVHVPNAFPADTG